MPTQRAGHPASPRLLLLPHRRQAHDRPAVRVMDTSSPASALATSRDSFVFAPCMFTTSWTKVSNNTPRQNRSCPRTWTQRRLGGVMLCHAVTTRSLPRPPGRAPARGAPWSAAAGCCRRPGRLAAALADTFSSERSDAGRGIDRLCRGPRHRGHRTARRAAAPAGAGICSDKAVTAASPAAAAKVRRAAFLSSGTLTRHPSDVAAAPRATGVGRRMADRPDG
jgi:hypothetical protein